MWNCRAIFKTCVGILIAASPAIAGDLAEIEPKLTEKLGQIQSFRGDMVMTAQIKEPVKVTQKMTGKVAGLLADGKYYTRQEGKSVRTIEMGEKPQTIEGDMLNVVDGEFSWSEQSANGQKAVMKAKPTTSPPLGKDYLTKLRDEFDLTRAADAAVEGAECWVIEAKFKQPRQAPGPQPEKLVLFFRQNDGAMVRTLGVLPDGNTLFTMDYSNIQLNPNLSASDFAYAPPEGVKVVDRTAPPAPNAASGPSIVPTSAPSGGK